VGSISIVSIGLEPASWRAPRIVVGRILGTDDFRYPGSRDVPAQRGEESLGFVRVEILKTLKGQESEPGQELRVFSPGRWFQHTHAPLLRDGVLSYADAHYQGGLDGEAMVPGVEILCFLGGAPMPPGFPPGADFSALEGAFDRADRAAAVVQALAEGPYGSFDHRIVLTIGGRIRLPGGLDVRLIGHSHKRPMTGGPTCESTHVEVSHQGQAGKLQLNHSTTPEGTQSWEGKAWGPFRVELFGMDYDVSSEIVVRKV